jgi:hypothetical protein
LGSIEVGEWDWIFRRVHYFGFFLAKNEGFSRALPMRFFAVIVELRGK